MTAKLGVEMLVKIMHCSGNIEPLRFIANNLGYELVKIEGVRKNTKNNNQIR